MSQDKQHATNSSPKLLLPPVREYPSPKLQTRIIFVLSEADEQRILSGNFDGLMADTFTLIGPLQVQMARGTRAKPVYPSPAYEGFSLTGIANVEDGAFAFTTIPSGSGKPVLL